MPSRVLSLTYLRAMSEKTIQIGTALRGMAMGMAEVVPGVSGGTIAFITGIYERLINAIKSIDGGFFSKLFKFRLIEAFRHVDGFFLLSLILGMVAGIVVAIFSITYLLEHYPPAVWAFFFGLIVGSTIYVLKQVDRWDGLHVVLVIVFALVAFCIVRLAPAEGSTGYLYIYISGMIAICALMLPGISGSFILLLMGMYKYITGTLKDIMVDFSTDKVIVMAVFGVGCLTGLAGFSRVLSWTFAKYRTQTLAALSGFMIGSLWKIWPWRLPVSWMDESGTIFSSAQSKFPEMADELKVLAEQNVMPNAYDAGNPLVTICVLTAVVGFVLVFALDRMGSKS